jgi:hypothetical protein
MSTGRSRPDGEQELDEEVLEDHEELADTILEEGEAYSSIRQRRDLEATYDDLDVEEKWRYALDVLHSRGVGRYSSPRELIRDFRAGEVLQDGEVPWNDATWEDYDPDGDGEVVVEEPFVTELDDGSTAGRASAYIDGEEEEGFVYRFRTDDGEEWEQLK